MVESYLEDGRQNEPEVRKSITDPCLGWERSSLVREIYQRLETTGIYRERSRNRY